MRLQPLRRQGRGPLEPGVARLEAQRCHLLASCGVKPGVWGSFGTLWGKLRIAIPSIFALCGFSSRISLAQWRGSGKVAREEAAKLCPFADSFSTVEAALLLMSWRLSQQYGSGTRSNVTVPALAPWCKSLNLAVPLSIPSCCSTLSLMTVWQWRCVQQAQRITKHRRRCCE